MNYAEALARYAREVVEQHRREEEEQNQIHPSWEYRDPEPKRGRHES